MDAGKLDRRLTIQRKTVTYDAFNEPIETWSDLTTVWASRRDISDAEKFANQELAAEIATRFQVRHSSLVSAVGPKDRVVCDGRTFAVIGVKEIGRRVGLELTAVARAE